MLSVNDIEFSNVVAKFRRSFAVVLPESFALEKENVLLHGPSLDVAEPVAVKQFISVDGPVQDERKWSDGQGFGDARRRLFLSPSGS